LFDNSVSRVQEYKGYKEIKDCTWNEKAVIQFEGVAKNEKFMLDLGFDGEIFINRKIFEQLVKKYVYSEIVGQKDFVCVFDNMVLYIAGFEVPNCTVIYNSRINANLVGAPLMTRFNFILNYQNFSKDEDNISVNSVLLKPSRSIAKSSFKPIVNQFGFRFKQVHSTDQVSRIKINGISYNAGMRVNDIIQRIDDLDMNKMDVPSINQYIESRNSIHIQVARNDSLLEFNLALSE
jgi:predicted aspartyl protease